MYNSNSDSCKENKLLMNVPEIKFFRQVDGELALTTEGQMYRGYVTGDFRYTRGTGVRLLGTPGDKSDLSCPQESHSSLMDLRCQDTLFNKGNYQLMLHCRSRSARYCPLFVTRQGPRAL